MKSKLSAIKFVYSLLCLSAFAGAANGSVTITVTETETGITIETSSGTLNLSALTGSTTYSYVPFSFETGSYDTVGILYTEFSAKLYTGDAYSDITYTASANWTQSGTNYSYSTTSESEFVLAIGNVDGSYDGIYVLYNYTSGNTIDAFTGTINGATYASLGLTAGSSLTASWGTGDTYDYLTINVVPEPATYASFAGFAALGGAFFIRRRKNRRA